MNKVHLIGRLARNPEIRYTTANEPTAICRFTLAVNRPFAKEGDITADFINCVCFGKRGENINKYFAKGNRIVVMGRLQVSNYTDKDNNKRYATDVVVEEFEFVDSKSEQPTEQATEPQGFSIDADSDDEDLPF